MTLRFSDPRHIHLLCRIAEGDLSTLKALYGLTALVLYASLRRRMDDDEIIERLLADIFAAIWKRPHDFHARSEWAGKSRETALLP
ncbi:MULTISPECIES: hypothetical protein [Asticcacaulis]|uniref:hypothetical protein n=1 Tax=Asticcacaulis TaxID=76890 RepID=UPI001AE1F23B|nr:MULTISPECIES: hypothetical protein [Asticcacaulis]MBP2159368.1 DNA-directed RNA polymerase specialized sigma24 family protein [Asticcacaulis solisilvae]MDR6800413.1 DNA-directed RNA polymerase specialized sigma24 family protein [Asticcacaulis sp. BE141]